MTKITAIIPTLNEESKIATALQTVAFADEIIVIDSYSQDQTIAIAKTFGAKIIQREFDDFSSQKNYAIQQAANDWILILDADETISLQLQQEILEKVRHSSSYQGFYIYRNFYFKDRILKYSGWRRDKVVRLFNRKYCKYEGLVHEKIVSSEPLGFLENKLNHYSYLEVEQYKSKLDFYAELQAKELLLQNKTVTPFHLAFKPLLRFFIQYILKLGFLDGKEGYIISKLHADGVYLRYKKYYKLKDTYQRKTGDISVFNQSEKPSKVSVVIVNYKSWRDLSNCLNELRLFQNSDLSLEIIVVDNNSNDGKLSEFVEQYHSVTFIENSGNNGFANGCNLGAKYAKGDYLFFLNPDTIANEKAIQKMYDYAKLHQSIGIVSCHQKNTKGNYENTIRVFPKWYTLFGLTRALYKFFRARAIQNRFNTSQEVIYPDWVSGSVIFISKKWFEAIGGWNENYWMYFEDVDLCKKVESANGKIALLQDVEIFHNHGGASRINMQTASLTKTEVIISKHVYISQHFNGLVCFLSQIALIINHLIFKLLGLFLGLIFFFIPKMKLQIYIAKRLFSYYFSALLNRTWLSKRSMNYR